MFEKNSKYFTTGEFAKVCKVNKQTLIYYDQIGLLAPVHKDDKGYRYYSIAQYEVFSVIELLKTLGMSLKEIQKYLAQPSPEHFLMLMREQQEIVSRKRKELEMIENMIRVKVDSYQQAATVNFNEIKIERYPEAHFYLSRNIENVTEEEFVTAVAEFIDELELSQLDTGYPIGGMTKREQVLKGNFTNYTYLYIEQPVTIEGKPYFKAIAGECLVGYHVGTTETLPKTYARLLQFMEKEGYRLGEYVYEEYIYDGIVKKHEEEYVIKIMLEVVEIKN